MTLLLTSERAFYEALGDALSQALSVQVERLFAIAGWLVGGLLVYTAINRFLFIPVEVRTERPIPSVVRRFIILVLLAVAVCGGLSFVYDRQLTGILATSGIIAMVIGLAVQMNISNLFAGLAIHFERPFRVGDWILVTPPRGSAIAEGQVIDMTWRTTRVAHQGLLDPVHPQQPGGRECRLQLQLARPDVPVQGRHQDQRRPPARQGREALGRCGLARPGRSAGTAADVPHSPGGAGRRRRVRVDFLLPGHRQRERHPPERVAERLAPPAERGHRPDQERVGPAGNGEFEAVRAVEVFRPFPDESLADLCQKLPRHEFAAGDAIVEKGETGDSMFVVVEGCVAVFVPGKDGQPVEVARLGVPDVFGEMALLTGEPRGATVRALTNTVVLEITKEDIMPLFDRQPEVMRQLAEIMALRKLASEKLVDRAVIEKRLSCLRIFRAITSFSGGESAAPVS